MKPLFKGFFYFCKDSNVLQYFVILCKYLYLYCIFVSEVQKISVFAFLFCA